MSDIGSVPEAKSFAHLRLAVASFNSCTGFRTDCLTALAVGPREGVAKLNTCSYTVHVYIQHDIKN